MRFLHLSVYILLILVVLLFNNGYSQDVEETSVSANDDASIDVDADADATSDGNDDSNGHNESSAKQTEKWQKGKKRSTKDWSKVNYDSIHKEWESGDDPELIEDEFTIQRRNAEKYMRNDGNQINFDDPAAIAKLIKDPLNAVSMSKGAGAAMMFAEIIPKKLNGQAWTKYDLGELAGRYSGLLRTGLVQCSIYDVGDEKKPQLLANAEKGYQASEVIKFLVQQPEIVNVTLDNKKYNRDNINDDDEL